MATAGKPRRFKTVEALKEAWEEYKSDCDNQMVTTHDFSSKNSEFVTKDLKRSITYTIEGFCAFVGIARSKFYEHYAQSKKYGDTVTRMKEECEIDARKKFELQIIPSQLAGLWMSNHGYSLKEKTVIASDSVSNILDALNGKAESVFSEPTEDVENS